MNVAPPFVDPPWDAPLDVEAALQHTPANATMKGMFLDAMVEGAKKRGVTLGGARARYVPFHDYPIREHMALLVESAHAFYPDLSLRQGLRKLGRGAHAALIASVVGRVVWATASDVRTAIEAMVKGYTISVPSCRLSVIECTDRQVTLRVEHVYWFLDSHHVGVFEGAMRAGGVDGAVRVRLSSPSDGELSCAW
ncbi:MAG: DUF2378 family protein [Myxococcales bacterium]|nr:DUF2378 family protein [Myxococcales bacterium]